MRTIENGLSMKTDPIEVYEHLFAKGNVEAPLVGIGPTAAISTEVRRFTLYPLAIKRFIHINIYNNNCFTCAGYGHTSYTSDRHQR